MQSLISQSLTSPSRLASPAAGHRLSQRAACALRLASRGLGLSLALACLPLAPGCSSSTPNPQKTVTDIDPIQARPDYWWDKPSPVRISAPDFDRALAACQRAARERFFTVDRIDARDGLVTTFPLTSAQFFEPWRRDNTTVGDIARSSLDTVRRTIHFRIEPTAPNAPRGSGSYTVIPQVLVERQEVVGRRITSVVGFRNFTFADQTTLASLRNDVTGTEEQPVYWYPVARDHNLEYELGKAIVNALH